MQSGLLLTSIRGPTLQAKVRSSVGYWSVNASYAGPAVSTGRQQSTAERGPGVAAGRHSRQRLSTLDCSSWFDRIHPDDLATVRQQMALAL